MCQPCVINPLYIIFSNILSIVYWLSILFCSAICNDGLKDAKTNHEKDIISDFLKESSSAEDFSAFINNDDNDDANMKYTNLDSTPLYTCNEPSNTSAVESSINTENTTDTSKLEKTLFLNSSY